MAWEQIAVARRGDPAPRHRGRALHLLGGERRPVSRRVGVPRRQADETLPTRGICHLVEHLAIEPQPRLYAHNGWCSIDSTGFWAEGDRDEVLDYLSGVARRLHPLPRDRMVAERQILATEGSQRGGSIVTTLLSCRWGARTYGTASYDEFGLFRLSEDEAQAWADRYFVADNAVLFMTGEPSGGLQPRAASRRAAQPCPPPSRSAVCSFPPASALGRAASASAWRSTVLPAQGWRSPCWRPPPLPGYDTSWASPTTWAPTISWRALTKPTSRLRRTVSTRMPSRSRTPCWR